MRLERRFPKTLHSGLLINEDETAEVAAELLNSSSNGYEVKIRAEIVELQLEEAFLQAYVSIEAVRARLNVDVHQAALLCLQKIQVYCRGEVHLQVDRPEGGVPAKEIE